MQEIFSSLGKIKEIRIIKDRLTGLSAGYGFVRYLHPPVAELARQVLNGAILCGLVCCPSHVCPMALGHGGGTLVMGNPPSCGICAV